MIAKWAQEDVATLDSLLNNNNNNNQEAGAKDWDLTTANGRG